jgi:transcriptional regulator with XRE-family HTH domain
MSIVKRLRAVRKGKRITQRQLAKMIGVSEEAVCQWETGAREPRLFILLCWTQALGVELILKEPSDAA